MAKPREATTDGEENGRREGDEGTHGRCSRGQLYVMIGNRDEAAECVQEAFVRARDHRSRLEGNPGRWVRTTAYRLAVSPGRGGPAPSGED